MKIVIEKEMKIKLRIKPLSVNQCWQGRRYKTPAYKNYETEVGLQLNQMKIKPIAGYLAVHFKFYLKNWKTTDFDNLIKPLLDILVKQGIIPDDRFIMKGIVEKIPSDKDFVEIEINWSEMNMWK